MISGTSDSFEEESLEKFDSATNLSPNSGRFLGAVYPNIT
jgi:hypothetical protein